MKYGAAAEHPGHGSIDRPRGAIDVKSEHATQAAKARAFSRFGKYRLRIEPGHKRLRADIMRDHAGGDPNRAVGTEHDAGGHEAGQHQRDSDRFSPAHAPLPQPL